MGGPIVSSNLTNPPTATSADTTDAGIANVSNNMRKLGTHNFINKPGNGGQQAVGSSNETN
jgi:hypothetical protein